MRGEEPMELSEKLLELRKKKGLSQLELAEELKVSRQAISRWEVGSAVPSIENLKCLGKLYGVSMDYLLNDEETAAVQQEPATQQQKQSVPRAAKIAIWVLAVLLVIVSAVLAAICISLATAEDDHTHYISEMEGISIESDRKEQFELEWP